MWLLLKRQWLRRPLLMRRQRLKSQRMLMLRLRQQPMWLLLKRQWLRRSLLIRRRKPNELQIQMLQPKQQRMLLRPKLLQWLRQQRMRQ